MKTVFVDETYNVSPDKIWEALTDKDKMKKWYFDLNEFKAEKDFEFSFAGKGHKGENYIHLCKVTEVVVNKKLQYSWEYEKFPGQSLVTFELSEEGSETRLKLTHSGLETFPQDNPDFAYESFKGGWTELLTKYLSDYLKKEV